jgi:copper chaperone CopZ
MVTLSIPDMHCNACKASVERALAPLAAGAPVSVDLAARRATVDGPAEVGSLIAALDRIGFPAVALPA